MSHKLPEWLNGILPEVRKPFFIDFEHEKYKVFAPSEKLLGEYENIVDAYDSVNDSRGVIFSNNIPEENINKRIYFSKIKDSTSSRALLSSTDQDLIKILESEYDEWLNETYPNYISNPKNFYEAYHFINEHPAFWHRLAPLSENTSIREKMYWHTSDGVSQLKLIVSQETDKGPIILLETGGRILPEGVSRYHDTRLDVRGSSFEDAIVKLAGKVEKFFNKDGSSKG